MYNFGPGNFLSLIASIASYTLRLLHSIYSRYPGNLMFAAGFYKMVEGFLEAKKRSHRHESPAVVI